MSKFSESITSSVNIYKYNYNCDCNMSTMSYLINEKILSSEMVKKIASSGLSLQHLKLTITRNGLEGLTQLFKEKLSDGKPRVTKLKRIIETVFTYLNKD